MNPWLWQTLVQCLGWTLLHFLWQGLAIAILLAGALRLLRSVPAQYRYLAGCLALLAMAAAPVITFYLVAKPDQPPPPAKVTGTVSAPAPTEVASVLSVPFVPPKSIAPPSVKATPPSTKALTKVPARIPLTFSQRLDLLLPWLVIAWLLGVAALSSRLFLGWLQIKRLQRRADESVADHLLTQLDVLAHRLGIHRPLRLLQSAWVEVPTVIGWLRPVILLPASCLTGLTPAQLEAILAHELAHIRRHDYLVNLLQSAVETLLFYHPAVWWVSRQIREERENCCDDLAVKVCGDPVVYARALATLEEMRPAPAQLALAASGSPLVQRIHRLLQQPARNPARPAWPLAGITTLALVGLLACIFQSPTASSADANYKPDHVVNVGRVPPPGAAPIAQSTLPNLPTQSDLLPRPATKEWGNDLLYAPQLPTVGRVPSPGVPSTFQSGQEYSGLTSGRDTHNDHAATNDHGASLPALQAQTGDTLASVADQAQLRQSVAAVQRRSMAVAQSAQKLLELTNVTGLNADHLPFVQRVNGTDAEIERQLALMSLGRAMFGLGAAGSRLNQLPVNESVIEQAREALAHVGEARPGVAPALSPTLLAQKSDAVTTAADEAIRREAYTVQLHQTLSAAQNAQKHNDLPKATRLYENCWQLVQKVGGTAIDRERKAVVTGLTAVLFDLAGQDQKLRMYDQADEKYRRILNIDPGNQTVRLSQIQNKQLLDEQVATTESPFPPEKTPTLMSNAQHASTLVRNGKLLFEVGELDRAEVELHHALDEDPDNLAANHYLALVAEKRMSLEVSAAQSRRGFVQSDQIYIDPVSNTLEHIRQRNASIGQASTVSPSQPKAATKLAQLDTNLATKPGPFARTNAVQISPGRKAIMDKLREIKLDSVKWDGLKLKDVVDYLSEQARVRDPEKQGIHFFISKQVEEDISDVSVTLDLKDVTMSELLDAITKNANRPSKYSILDYAVVFSARPADSFEDRTFHLDPNEFEQSVRSATGLPFPTNGLIEPKGSGIHFGYTVSKTNNAFIIRQYFLAFGVDLNPDTGRVVMWNTRNGAFIVIATRAELEMIEAVISTLFARSAETTSANSNGSKTSHFTQSPNPARSALIDKLRATRIDAINYPGMQLKDVLTSLTALSRAQDPDGKGINFFISKEAPPPLTVTPDKYGFPQPSAPVAIDISDVTVNFTLDNVTLLDLLDIIAKSASRPIKYSILDYAVVFSARTADPLEVRTFHVDPNTFEQGLRSVSGIPFGNTSTTGVGGGIAGDPIAVPPVSVGVGNGGGATGIQYITNAPSSAKNEMSIVRQFFLAAGVDLNTNTGKAVVWNDRRGTLTVRATAADLDMIAAALNTLNQSPPDINVKTKFPTSPPTPSQFTNSPNAGSDKPVGGRQNVLNKLNRIRIDSVKYSDVPLKEVLSALAGKSRAADPDGTGINFLLGETSGVPDGRNVGDIRVRIGSAAKNIRITDILSFIQSPADSPIEYSITDQGVIFSLRNKNEPSPLEIRTFHVDSEAFIKSLENLPGVPPSLLAGRHFGELQSAVRQLLISAGADLDTNKPANSGKAIFYVEQNGMLTIRATVHDLDKVISFVQALNHELAQNPSESVAAEENHQVEPLWNTVHPSRIDDVDALETRTFHVDPNTFNRALESVSGIRSSNATSATNLATTLRQCFLTAGVDLDTNTGKAVVWSDRRGLLTFRATRQDLDLIAAVLDSLNTAPPQVNIKVKIAEIAKSDARALGGQWLSGSNVIASWGSYGSPPGAHTLSLIPESASFPRILSDPQFRLVINALEQRDGADLLAAPEVTTEGGREVHISLENTVPTSATNPPSTPFLDMVAKVSADEYSIRMNIVSTVSELLGYDNPGQAGVQSPFSGRHPTTPVMSVPRFRSHQITNTVTVWDGETIVIGGMTTDAPLRSIGTAGTTANAPIVKKNLMVFITPRLINPDGTHYHSDDQMPLAKQASIPQVKTPAN